MSSTVQARTYDYPASVTASNTVNDPAGPFAGVLVTSVAGGTTLVVYPRSGPLASTGVTFTGVTVGMYVEFPVARVGASTNCTVVGLKSPIVAQGAGQ